ncbi:magnesium transporter CorA [Staphylococcus taiwanensis]|nr:magnesium transporter CorA [Staphylococcus taiwanensis]
MSLTIRYLNEENYFQKTQDVNQVPNTSKLIWYDFTQPTERERQILVEQFKITSHRIKESVYTISRPKFNVNHHQSEKYLVLHAIDDANFSAKPISITVQKNKLITIHEDVIDEIHRMEHDIHNGTLYATADELAVQLLDEITSSYFKYVNTVEDTVFSFENKNVDSVNNKKMMQDVYDIRSQIIKLKRVLIPMEEMLEDFENYDFQDSANHIKILIQHIHSRLDRQKDTLIACEQITDDIKDNNESYRSNRINGVMNVLTIISSIFFPLSFLTGWYGMNFSYMPELNWHYSYFVFIAISIIVVLSLVLLFKKKKWF